MRKVFLFISLIISLAAASQNPPQQSIGAPGNMVYARGFFGFDTAIVYRTSWADTAGANLNPYLRFQAGAQIRVRDTIWQRSHDLSRWFRAGAGSVIADSTNTIQLSGNGSTGNPLLGNVIISTQQGNNLVANADGLYARSTLQDGIIEPGAITWIQNYDYDVSPAIGVIGGIQYTSDWTPITLATADPTLDRFDVVAFNAGGTISVITGTPASNPQLPTIDPTTQLSLGFILVTANTTAPPSPPTQDWIYINNAEWTTASSTARINPASTTLPYSVPLDIEFSAAQNGDNIRFTSVSPPTISNFNIVTLKIRSSAIWANDSRIGLQWISVATPVGSEVSIANGAFGYSSTNLSGYQIVSIPLTQFGALSSVTALLVTVRTTGNRTVSCYVDDIQLQNGILPTVGYTANNAITLSGNNFEWGGSLIKNTLVATDQFAVTMSGATTPSSTFNFNVVNTTGSAIKGQTTTGTGVQGSSAGANGYGVFGQNTVGIAGQFLFTNSSGNTSATVLGISKATSGTPSAGMGANLTFFLSGTATPSIANLPSNRIVSTWTNATTLSQVSQLVITGTNAAVEADLFTLSGNGATRLNKYGVGSFTAGTPAYGLAVDASGNIMEYPAGGGIAGITADNGLTASTPTNVQLGGSFIQNTTITSANASFRLNISGINTGGTGMVSVTTTGSNGNAVSGTSTSGNGVAGVTTSGAAGVQGAGDTGDGLLGTSNSGRAVAGSTGSGTGLYITSNTGKGGQINVLPSSTSTRVTVLQVTRFSTGTPANNMAGSLDFTMGTSASGVSDQLSNRITSLWSDATHATRTSRLIISGVNSATTGDIFTIEGNGALTLGAAYQGLGAGYLAVSNTGVVTWSAGGGGGGGDALTANPLSQFAATTSAQLAGVISNETGTNLLVFSDNPTLNSPTFVTPALGTPASGTLTNATGLPISTGVSGLGTGVATALAINTGSAGAIVLFNGNLGTPNAGTVSTGVTLGDVTMNVTGTDATGDIYYRDAGGLLTRLGIGTSGQVLRVSAGGIIEWFTTSGSGTVTTVGWTGGIVSIANPTTTPAFTIAGTSGGGVYFSSSSTWASTGVLAANAIMIGGGAGAAYSTTTTGTGVLTALGVNVGSAGAFVTFNGAGGTPSSLTLTNATGLPLSTGIAGTLPIANGGTGLTTDGAANELLGVESDGSGLEYKALSGNNGISITHSVGGIAISNTFNPSFQTLTDGATITWNVTNGGNAVVTLNGTGRTLSISNAVAGYTYYIRIIQGSGGSKTITTWPTNTKWPNNGTIITLSTTAGEYDVVSLTYDGTNFYASYQNDYN